MADTCSAAIRGTSKSICDNTADETIDTEMVGWVNEALAAINTDWYMTNGNICIDHLSECPEI